jgi:hypothetical protein
MSGITYNYMIPNDILESELCALSPTGKRRHIFVLSGYTESIPGNRDEIKVQFCCKRKGCTFMTWVFMNKSTYDNLQVSDE